MGLFSSSKGYASPAPPAGAPAADPPGYSGHQITGSVSGQPVASGSGWGYQPGYSQSGVGAYTATGYPDEKKEGFPADKAQTVPSQQPADVGSLYACMVLGSSDKLRLLNFPTSVWDAVEQVLLRTWIGIQRKRVVDNATIEFKLRGNPCR